MIVVTRDSVVRTLKNRIPWQSEQERQLVLSVEFPQALVVLGDTELGRYTVLRELCCEKCVVCIGYDQQGLHNDLSRHVLNGELPLIQTHTLKAHRGDELHTSLLYPVI